MNGDTYSSRGEGRRGRDHPSSRGDRDDRRDRHRDRDGPRDRDRDRDRDRERDRDRGDREGRDRRRSRSPDHRGGHRRGEGDVDAYSSSRNHRDREREDRYSGRDRRGEREWDRDRASSRRDPRRDDDERPSRRDRDAFDDRRRGGRDRRDDGGLARQEAHRSPTPPPRPREPTPDLTDIVSVLARKRRMTQWDIKPPGYEVVTAEQAKLSGMFPLPGAPRQQPIDLIKLPAFMMREPNGGVSSAGLKANNSRQSKRLIVSNIPAGSSEEAILSFFNLQLNGLNVIESPDPCTLCQFSTDRSFAVLEFRNSNDATVALAMDGISMEADDAANGADGERRGLAIRRPKDYVMPAIPDNLIFDPNVVSNVVPDTVHKLSITNIPTYLTDDQIIELLAAFGKPKSFVLVKDRSTEESRGIAFTEYQEPGASNEPALNALNGMDVGGNKLVVKKASIGSTQVANFDVGITAISGLASQLSNTAEKGRVLQLLNMVTPEELMDNEEYEEICDDVRDECSKYGAILELKIPRPIGGSRQSAGVGKIYVKFDTPDSCFKALTALAGRKFADRTVVTTYFPEENFDVSAW